MCCRKYKNLNWILRTTQFLTVKTSLVILYMLYLWNMQLQLYQSTVQTVKTFPYCIKPEATEMLDDHSGINQQHLRKGDVLDKTIGTVTACDCICMCF